MSRPRCVLFAGQSVQETGMCAALWRNKAARAMLERLVPVLGEDLEEITTRMPEAELALTYNAQRAIHAHHLGHWAALEAAHPDLALDGAIGHSMGVVAALVAAGALTPEDSGRFIKARAESFSRVCKGFAAPMGLAAVTSDELPDAIDEINAFPGVSLALHNTTRKAVAGGALSDLEALAAKADEEGWPVRIKVLKVEGPYHTPAFAASRADLAEILAGLPIARPRVPVFMGTSGKAETEPETIRRLLAEQADSRERHQEAVAAAYAHGCRSFLEAAHKPQPVTWLSEQLVDGEGRPLPGIEALAVATEDLEKPFAPSPP